MNKKEYYRLFPTIIMLLAVFLLGTSQTFAAPPSDQEEWVEGEYSIRNIHINPLYKNIVSLDDFYSYGENLFIDEEANPEMAGAAQNDSYTYYTTVSQAASAVREQLKNHETAVTVGYRFNGSIDWDVFQQIFDKSIEHNGDPKAGDYILSQYMGYQYRYYWYSDSSGTYVRALYWVKWFTNISQEQFVDQKVSEIISRMKSMTTSKAERIRFLYEYLCDHVTYDHATLEDKKYLLKFTAYGALAHGTAVCNGYSALLYRLLLEAGIDCRYIVGMQGEHSWNIVYLDGYYYNMDSTWDAGKDYASYTWFLRSYADFPDHPRDYPYNTTAFENKYPIASTSKNPVYFYPISQGDLQYNLICGELTVVRYLGLGTPRTLVIPDHVNGYPVTRIKGDAFNDYDKLTSVTLPKTLRKIEDGSIVNGMVTGAFANCDNLVEIKTQDNQTSLQEIGLGAFWNCDSLQNITLPDGLTKIGPAAIGDCYSMTKVIVPYSTRYIYDSAFAYLNADVYVYSRTCTIADSENVFGTGVTIHGYSGSTVEKWAKKYNRSFAAMDVAAHEHSWVWSSVIREPSCLERGRFGYTCNICGLTKEEDVEMGEHVFSKWMIVEDVTCVKAGKRERFCSLCGKSEEAAYGVPAGHSYGNWNTVIPASAQKTGTAVQYCTVCGAANYKTLQKLSSNTASGGKKQSITATSLKVNTKSKIKLKKGKKKQLKVQLIPGNSTSKVTFTSSKKKVASVSATGLIKARKKGKTVITIKAGKATKKITVTVY